MSSQKGFRAQCRRYAGFVVGSSVFNRLRRSIQRGQGTVRSGSTGAKAIVVGIDGSTKSLAAVRWAAAEAAGRGLPLRLVCAVDPADGAAALPTPRPQILRQAQAMLDDATKQGQAGNGHLSIETCIVERPPTEALVRAAGPATMICVGASACAPPHPGHHASVVTEIVVAADCPVTIVRTGSGVRRSVVAEINNEPSGEDVLRMAVQEAVLRQLSLRLVTGSHGQGELTRMELHERIERSLGRWRLRHPELDALNVSIEWSLEQYLQRYADEIALFVAPPRQVHAIGTILHPSAALALAALDCPVTLCVAGTTDAVAPKVVDYEESPS